VGIRSLSFWQQNQNFWARAAQRSQQQASSAALMSVMSDAMTNLARGMAGIANQTALNRTNAALSAAVQSALQGPNASLNATPAPGANTSSHASASHSPADSGAISGPATGTGTVPLTASTTLFALRILKGDTISVSNGIGTTVYSSTGSDTVGDLIRAINGASAGHANAFAWLDGNGKLHVALKDTTHTLTIGGTVATAVGFGAGNNIFRPTVTAAVSPAAGTSSGQTPTSASSSTKTSSVPLAQDLTGGTAEILLASNGSAGNLLNLLA
jgi:hypothetical protein